MANYIDRVEVNGTEYEIVGPDAEYPISNVVSNDIYNGITSGSGESNPMYGYSDSVINTVFRWKRTGEEGSYEYKLVLCTDSGPDSYSYVS
jgi:hypothetical protein